MKTMLSIAVVLLLMSGVASCADEDQTADISQNGEAGYYIRMTVAGTPLNFTGGYTEPSLGNIEFTNASLIAKPFGASIPGSMRSAMAFDTDCSSNTVHSTFSNNCVMITFPNTNSTISNTGTYTNGDSAMMLANINGENFISIPPVSFTITGYGEVGGTISGFFSCILSNTNTNTGGTVTINDGTFNLKRAYYMDAVFMMMLLSFPSPWK